MKSDLKRNISVICLLAGLGLVWLGAKDGIWTGDEVRNAENMTCLSPDDSSMEDVAEDVLADRTGPASCGTPRKKRNLVRMYRRKAIKTIFTCFGRTHI